MIDRKRKNSDILDIFRNKFLQSNEENYPEETNLINLIKEA